MDDLTQVWPVSEPVALGPWRGTAVCFQLRDLARLQGVAKALSGDPLDGRRLALREAREAADGDYLADSEAGRAYAAALRGAIRAAEGWPPRIGGPEAEALLAAPAGRVLWLEALLGRCNPGFTAETAASLLSSPDSTAEQWLRLQAIAYADHPLDELDRLADPPPRRRGGGRWGEAIVGVIRETGWTFEQAGALYLSQWILFRSSGKQRPGDIAGDRARVDRVADRRRRLMQMDPGTNGHAG